MDAYTDQINELMAPQFEAEVIEDTEEEFEDDLITTPALTDNTGQFVPGMPNVDSYNNGDMA
ncbi:hypothetical protein D3C71_1095520 [compost metagenome]